MRSTMASLTIGLKPLCCLDQHQNRRPSIVTKARPNRLTEERAATSITSCHIWDKRQSLTAYSR
jgi:hypothetical protein